MNWVLVLALTTNPNGNYVKQFETEAQCVREMKTVIGKNQNSDTIKSVMCVPETTFITMTE